MVRKCKVCKKPFKPTQSLQTWCSPEHGYQLARDKVQQKRKKERVKEKRDYQLSDLKIRKKSAVTACHAYIRFRDKDNPCICCGKPLGKNYHAGHYIPSVNGKIKFDERNIHGQRLDCNYFKHGDSGDYRINLIAKIGLDQVEEIEGMKGGIVKRTAQNYLEIEEYYKTKLKLLQQAAQEADTA